MNKQKKLSVSHAPFWHSGRGIKEQNYNIIAVTLPLLIIGMMQYGISALGVVSLSISSAMIWDISFNHLTKRTNLVYDGNSFIIGLFFGLMLPASSPWWLVVVGTFIAVIIGLHIFGGIGGNPFNPVALSMAILMVSWKDFLDLDETLLFFKFNFVYSVDPLALLKHFGVSSIQDLTITDLFLGNHVGTIGSAPSFAILIAGLYLIIKRIIKWEICLSFLIAVIVTSMIFNIYNPIKYAGPMFHLFTGLTMFGVFFLATDNSSSPVNFIAMLLYGATAGIMTILIRNIGLYVDGVVFAILIANLINPIVDKIRPKAIGKVV